MRILIILFLGSVIAAGYYWLIYKPQKDAAAAFGPHPEGSYCTAHVSGGIAAGKIKNGICVPIPVVPGEIPCGGIINPC